jgi:carboxymethylenebutenolidase
MRTETVTLHTPDGVMPAYVARPDGEAPRAVVVFQEAFGVNPHIEDVTRRVADAGYVGIAPHLFHRTLEGFLPYGDITLIRPHMTAVTDEGVLDDFDAAASYLAENGIGGTSTGVVGFCLGGRLSFMVSLRRRLGAGVTFYGGGIVQGRGPAMPSLMDLIPSLSTAWLGLFGDQDQGIPVPEVEELQTTLEAHARVETEIVRYPKAGHGFHCDARPQNYVEDAAQDGWRRTLEWFERHLA